jgi:hypothetical protein
VVLSVNWWALWCRLQHQRPTYDEVGMRKTVNGSQQQPGALV